MEDVEITAELNPGEGEQLLNEILRKVGLP